MRERGKPKRIDEYKEVKIRRVIENAKNAIEFLGTLGKHQNLPEDTVKEAARLNERLGQLVNGVELGIEMVDDNDPTMARMVLELMIELSYAGAFINIIIEDYLGFDDDDDEDGEEWKRGRNE